jgi:hypothetical protein
MPLLHHPEDTHAGTVAVTGTGHNEPCRTGRSGSKTEELIDETDFAYWPGLS